MKVRKRDGSLEDFDTEKIVESIFRSAQTVGGRDRDMAKRLAKEVVAHIQIQFKAEVVSTEDIGNVVEKILKSFKDGTKDNYDFWLNVKDKLVYIRYFAVRDRNNRYLGTVEVTQDIAPIQLITGEKRLLGERD